MTIKIPYNKLELTIALSGISENDKDFIKKLTKIKDDLLKKMPGSKKERNKLIAEENGISVKDLLNSPNYELLGSQYEERIFNDFRNRIKDDLNLTEKQSWAIVAVAFGLMD